MSRAALRKLSVDPDNPPAGYMQIFARDSGRLVAEDDDGEQYLLGMRGGLQKSVTIENPTNTEDISLFFVDRAITITAIHAVIGGTTSPSIRWTIRHDPDRSAIGNEVVTGGTLTSSTTGGDTITTLDDPSIPADSNVWLETSLKNGEVNNLNLTIFYTED